jgi:hypothetical protein
MFCHRLLRPIADTRTVAEGTDSNAMINRAAAPADQHVSPISAAQPIKSAALRVWSPLTGCIP